MRNRERITAREAAKAGRMSVWMFYRFAHGKVPGVPKLSPVRIGKRAVIEKTTFEEWLRKIEAGRIRPTVVRAEWE